MRFVTSTIVAGLLCWGGLAAAQGPQSLTVAGATELARAENPMLRAARLKADAAAQRISPAGAWPDPELTFGLANRMVSALGATADPMTMNEVQLTQMVPWPGKLGFAREQARRLAQADRLDADDAELMLLARVKGVYYEVAYMDRALVLMRRSRELLRDFLQVSQAMYGVGSGLQQDVLQAQVAVARMSAEITVMEQERVAMAARLNALLGRSATTPVGELELPVPGDTLPAADSLMALAVSHRPALRAAQERVAAGQASYRGARRELFPDFMVGVTYGQRPQFEDMASLMIGVRVPLWAGWRQLPMRREMLVMQAMAEAEARDTYNKTYAQLVEMRADAERSRTLAQLYAASVVPQARASVDAALAAYRVGKADYMNVVENQMTANRYETESVRLAAAYQKAVAEIQALVTIELAGAR